MRSRISLCMLVFVFSVSLVVGIWSRLHSQALPADIFSMPLGYQYGIEYRPKIIKQNDVITADTSYGVQNPGLGNSIRCFGVAWDQLYHAGVDLYRADGTSTDEDEVNAVANGEVMFAKDVRYPGYVVIIKHDDPFDDPNNPKPIYSVYGHLHTVFVTKGDIVARGQVIGTVELQAAGGYEDSHLHFEIRYFEDGGNLYPNTTTCNGKTGEAGVGYTYPDHPDDFPAPGLGYTDPLAFIHDRSGQFLPLIDRAPTPTVTPTPIITPTPTRTPTPTLTPTPTCVANLDLVKNGDFEDTTQHYLWVSNHPEIALIFPYATTPTPNYGLVLGRENGADQTVYQVISIPSGVHSLDIKFWLYVETYEPTSISFDNLYVDMIDHATGTSIHYPAFAPLTNEFSPQKQWVQQVFHVSDVSLINGPIRLKFHVTTNWLWPTQFVIDKVQLVTGC